MGETFEPHPALGAEHLEAETGAGRGHGAEVARHAFLHAHQDRGGVVGLDRRGAAEALGEGVIDRPAQIDHAVDGVDAHRHQAAERRFGFVGAPMARIDEQHVGKRHGRFDVQNGAEFAAADHVAELDHLRMETAVVADCERDAGLAHGGNGVFGLALGQRERLFAIDVLAGGGRGHHLRRMHGVRRRQHHGVDARMMQHAVVLGGEVQALLLGERLDLGRDRARRCRREADHVAVLRRLDQRLAPPPQSDDARFDHLLLPQLSTRSILVSCSYRGHVSMASTTQLSIQNTQYSTPPITQIHFLVTL